MDFSVKEEIHPNSRKQVSNITQQENETMENIGNDSEILKETAYSEQKNITFIVRSTIVEKTVSVQQRPAEPKNVTESNCNS